MRADTLVKNGRVVFPLAGVQTVDIAIEGGKVSALLDPSQSVEAQKTIDVRGNYVLPGVIDPHVHLGMGSSDDYTSETRAAATGGVTTIGNFLMKSDPYEKLLAPEVEQGNRNAFVDYFLHFTVMNEQQLDSLERYIQMGVASFKYFMHVKGELGSHMGVQGTDEGMFYDLLSKLGKHPRSLTAVHAENIEVIVRLRKRLQEKGRDGLVAWEESRPDFSEADALYTACFFARLTGARIYVVHLSCQAALTVVRPFRQSYSGIYVETCPHYLTHTKHSDVGVLGKIAPPLRSESDIEALWEAVFDGTVDTMGSDHNSRKRDTKEGRSIWDAAGGMPNNPVLLPVLLSEGVNKRGLPMQRVAELTSYNPAKIFNLYPKKGTIQVGSDADLTVVDLDLQQEVRPQKLHSHSDYSLYEGWNLKGWPVLTMVRGKVIMKDGQILGEAGYGRFIPTGQPDGN